MPEKSEADAPQVDLQGQLTIELDGAEYVLRPSRQAISNIEKAIGRARGLNGPVGLAQLAMQCSSFALSVEELGICVAEMMRAHATHNPEASADYRGAKPEKCADLIYEGGELTLAPRIGAILTYAMAGGYTASGEVRAIGTKTTEPTLIAD